MRQIRFLTAEAAVALIEDGMTVASHGFTVSGVPEALIRALEARFLATGHPRGLTFVHSSGMSDRITQQGINHLAHDGLLRRLIGSHWGLAPRVGQFIHANRLEAYCLPQGQIAHLYRAIACGDVGLLSRIGLGTFVDPRQDGGKVNSAAAQAEDLVELVHVGGVDSLLYRSFPIHVALLRGTSADDNGNISQEEEPVSLETLTLAQAARASGGLVIVQVKRRVPAGALHPKHVVVPAPLVDVVVVAEDPAATHRQSAGTEFNPAYCGDERVANIELEPLLLDLRKVIGRRAAMELRSGAIVNLGVGIPADTLGSVAAEEGIADKFTLSIEAGAFGGRPLGGADFGVVLNADAFISQPAMFDFYNGGGVDQAFIGAGEIDALGNVNASKFGEAVAGCGGFIDITQPAKQVIFCTAFTAAGSKIRVADGRLHIDREGSVLKFVPRVSHITFSAEYARRRSQPVLFVTERAVFRLTDSGIILTEIAPGIDLERDILARMGFRPAIAPDLRLMDARIFDPAPMGLGEPSRPSAR